MISSPIYSKIWHKLKSFPAFMYQGSNTPPSTSGSAAAALISGGIGTTVMMIVHHLADSSQERDSFMKLIGSWIPGSMSLDPMWGNIGSYAGKETFLLIGWLGSWIILYPLLKDRQVKPRTIFFFMFSLYTLSTVMTWHPFFPYLPLR